MSFFVVAHKVPQPTNFVPSRKTKLCSWIPYENDSRKKNDFARKKMVKK